MIKYLWPFFLVLFMIALGNASTVELVDKPGYHEVTQRGVTVRYRKDACGSLSGNVLLNVAHNSEAGVFDWENMDEPEYKRKTLYTECRRLRKEMISRSLKDTILNR